MCHCFFWLTNKSKIEIIGFGTSPFFFIWSFCPWGNIALKKNCVKTTKVAMSFNHMSY